MKVLSEGGNLQYWTAVVVLSFLLLFQGPAPANSESLQQETRAIKQQLQQMQEQMKLLQEKLEQTEQKLEKAKKEQDWNSEDIENLNERVATTEKHTSADKVEFGIELEPRLWSIQMDNVYAAPSALTGLFFTPYNSANPFAGGLYGATLPEIQQMFQGMQAAGMVPPAEEIEVDNDAVRTLKFRLRMDAEVNKNLRFAGRLAAYKVWGDSVGINYNSAGMQDVTMDGTTASNPHGDVVHLERGYFVYNNEFKGVPWYISLGRRPSTEGMPLQYKKNYPYPGGSPSAHIINWQFDGGSLHFGLEELTGIPGFDLKFCYGSGFESQYGTTGAFLDEPTMDDVDLYGVIGTLYENYLPSADLDLSFGYNYAYAPNISDGFTGLTVMPFIVSTQDTNQDGVPEYYFDQNTGLYTSRVEPTENIGDWQALSVGLTGNFWGTLDVYLSGAWSHTKAEKVSKNPLYEMQGLSLLSSNGDLESHDGYSFFGGIRYALKEYGAKFGLEYNYGSKYWFNFTGAEDNLIGSKLATRGHVLEPYYIQSISGDNFFFRLGAQFYKFNYSGSGNPLGEPVDIDDITGMDALFPVVEDMQQYYLSVVYRF